MSEFYVTKSINEKSNAHIVHKDDCNALPETESLKYLGSIASSKAAVSLSRKSYAEVSCCPNCLSQAYPATSYTYAPSTAELETATKAA